YKFGGNSIMGIDCSAYVQKVYSLIGITIPRSARLQFEEGEIVDRDSLSIGDLVFFRTYASFPSHVGIYLGNDLFIHASSKGKKVSINSLKTPYYFKRFIGGKRFIIDNAEIEITKQLHEG
ncbi:MAG: NlpC/P60 family protein, partial [Nitrospirae bacterium]|nr:NlpC/P60 family protein [Nitrospirota bacterium]